MRINLRSPERAKGCGLALGAARGSGFGVAAIVASAIIAVLAVAPGAAVSAQAAGTGNDSFAADDNARLVTMDDDLFRWNEDDLFGGSEDDLFGGDGLIVESVARDTDKSLADDLLVSEGVEFGGNYNVGFTSSWAKDGLGGAGFGGDDKVSSRVQLGGSLYADARPNRDVRLFAKARMDGGGDVDELGQSGELTLTMKPELTELFSDFHLNDRVYFRAGKQMIHWGVGYFFSPADIVNVGRIDPENPEADREGPVALKANMPAGSDNYYVHVIADSVAGQTRLAVAPKAEWVVGGTELGLGAYYRADRAPRAMMTMTGTLGKVSFFGEGVVSYGSDKRFLQADSGAPFGVKAVRKDEQLFVQGTVGIRHSWNDPDGRYNVTGAAQYYYNGEGYAAGEFEGLLENHPLGVGALMVTGELSIADLAEPGRHYAALSLNWMEAFNSRFSPGLFWMGNIQGNTGMVAVSLGVKTWEKLRLSLGANHTYGAEGSEYAPLGASTTLFVTLGFAGSF